MDFYPLPFHHYPPILDYISQLHIFLQVIACWIWYTTKQLYLDPHPSSDWSLVLCRLDNTLRSSANVLWTGRTIWKGYYFVAITPAGREELGLFVLPWSELPRGCFEDTVCLTLSRTIESHAINDLWPLLAHPPLARQLARVLPVILSNELNTSSIAIQKRFVSCLVQVGYCLVQVGHQIESRQDLDGVTIEWVEDRLRNYVKKLTHSKAEEDQRLGYLQVRLLHFALEYERGSMACIPVPWLGAVTGDKVHALVDFLGLKKPDIVPWYAQEDLSKLFRRSGDAGALRLCFVLGITHTNMACPDSTEIGGEEMSYYRSHKTVPGFVALVLAGTSEDGAAAAELLCELGMNVYVHVQADWACHGRATYTQLLEQHPSEHLLVWEWFNGSWIKLTATPCDQKRPAESVHIKPGQPLNVAGAVDKFKAKFRSAGCLPPQATNGDILLRPVSTRTRNTFILACFVGLLVWSLCCLEPCAPAPN